MKKTILLAFAVILSACGKPADDTTPGLVDLDVPEGLALHGATDNSLTFQWNTVEGARGYEWLLTGEGDYSQSGSTSKRNQKVENLTPGTTYSFSVQAVRDGVRSGYCTPVEATTTGSIPAPPDPSATTLCVDAPLVVEVGPGATLGSTGLVQVFKADDTLVDTIDLADMAKVTVLDDGTMIPKEQIKADTPFHTFMDALHSTRWRPVHYTPLRIEGGKLLIKLHNEALDFGQSYYVTVDASVAGKAVGKDDMPFTTKARPSGTTLQVKADGSADFCTVQGALSYASTLGKDTPVTIEIGDGTYREMLYLRDKNKLTLKGQSRNGTVIAYPNNESYATGSGAAANSKPGLGASIGVMGGRCLFLAESCNELVLEDLTIDNTFYASDHKGQAETIYFNGDNKRLTVERCNLVSWQDTFLCKGEVYVHSSLIAGHVDFIWGYPKVCLFEECEILSRAGGYIIQARVPSASSKGFVFLNCVLSAMDGVANGSVYLARSAGQTDCYDNVTYVNCSMGPAIALQGWYTSPAPNPSTPTATAGWKEYGTWGASTTSRNVYGRMLTAAEAEAYSSKAAVLGW